MIIDCLREGNDSYAVNPRKMEKEVNHLAIQQNRCKRHLDTVALVTHSAQHMVRYAETVKKINHFKVVCRGNKGRRGTLYDIEQEAAVVYHIDTVNNNSIGSNSKQMLKVAELKTT